MKLSIILAGTAIASLAVFADVGAPIGLSTVPAAQAQATVNFSIFYNDLADHGDWVRYRDAYVFIPANVQRGWRPYTLGHWVYANDYGWTWASDEPFGWATYHYGRWGYGEEIGWYWVPGTRWAPAWVSWRRSNDHIVWAPLPPRGGTDVSIEISVGDIPDFYWVAVPTRSFLEVDLRAVIIDSDRDRRRIVERAEFLGTSRVENNIVVNTVIDIDIIQRETGREVRRVDVRKSNDPREARVTDEQVTVVEGEVQAEAEAKPKRVKKVEEVKKVTVEETTQETEAEQPAGEKTPETATETTGEEPAANQAEDTTKTKKKNQPAQAETDTGVTAEEPSTGQAEGTTTKKKKPAQAEAPAANTETTTEAEVETPAKDKKAKADAEVKVEGQPQEQASQPEKKKKQNASEEDVTTGSTGKAKKGNKNQECDPSVNPDCAVQQ